MTEPSAKLIQWMAQTVHRAHHFDSRTFWDCPQSTCRAAAEHLRELKRQHEREALSDDRVAEILAHAREQQ